MAKRKTTTPLRIVRELGFSEDGSEPVVVTHRQRGLAMDLRVEPLKRKLHNPIYMMDGRRQLERLTQEIRSILEAEGIPTDQAPIVPRGLDFGYCPAEDGEVADEDIWFGIAEDSTEPLSKEHTAAVLLHAIKAVTPKMDNVQLRQVVRLMHSYHNYQIGNSINDLVATSEAWKERRSVGPKTKGDRSRDEFQIILELAESYWRKHSEHRGRHVITAKRIVTEVNEDRQRRDPKCKLLEHKTISNKLSAYFKDFASPP